MLPGYRLLPESAGEAVPAAQRSPDVIVAAADHQGRIVRLFEAGDAAHYFGSAAARNGEGGAYDPDRETRAIASTGKMLAAIAIANEGRDEPGSLYLDTQAPERGLETCDRSGTGRYGRKAIVTFACSLNNPLITRAAHLGQPAIRRLIDTFGFRMPPPAVSGEETPASTAAVLGLVSGSPRRVHHMAGVVLAALINQRQRINAPSLVQTYDYTSRQAAEAARLTTDAAIDPAAVIRRDGLPFLKAVLQAPLCYRANGTAHGTLKSLQGWCAESRSDLRLHFAKTGTSTTRDPNATVDAWIAGGLQFGNGAAYSYVVVVGTGSTAEPWAHSLHAAQLAAPLVETLLADLARHARSHPQPKLLPAAPKPQPLADHASPPGADQKLQAAAAARERVFSAR
jgi:membrane peptidoglycan carboxypeptidase